MATRPTDIPAWATDANYPAGSDPWSGTPTRVEPSAGQQADGNEPGTRLPAQWFNWLLGLGHDWTAWFAAILDVNEEHTYQTPKTRTRFFHATSGMQARAQGSANMPWFTPVYGLTPNEGWDFKSLEDFARLYFPLHHFVPPGSTVTKIRALVKPGAARSIGNRMSAWYFDVDPNFSAPGVTYGGPTASDEDDGTTAMQVLDTGTISISIGNKDAQEPVYQIVAGNDAGTNRDQVVAIELTYTDIGPRNP